MTSLNQIESKEIDLEQQALRIGVIGNVVMTVAGFAAHLLTGSSALLLDGLYSAVMVGSSMIAAQISRNVLRPPDRAYPYGYDGQEALYVLFRSLVLIGVLVYGISSALGTIFSFLQGNEIDAINLGPVGIYTVAVVMLCAGLSWYFLNAWEQSGRVSLLLMTEASNARIDAVITATTGVALMASPLLVQTPLSQFVPMTDALLVLLVSAVLIKEPVTALRDAVAQTAGKAADPKMFEATERALNQELSVLCLQMMDFTLQQLGRTVFLVVYINPAEKVEAEMIDCLRQSIDGECAKVLQRPVRTEVILTVKAPIHPLVSS